MTNIQLEEPKFCVNCTHYRVEPWWLLHFIPIVGSLLLWGIKNSDKDGSFKDGVHRVKLCDVSGTINPVTGKTTKLMPCHKARTQFSRYHTSDGLCTNFLSKGRPLKDVPDKWIVTEIKKRGLLKVMQNAKRDES